MNRLYLPDCILYFIPIFLTIGLLLIYLINPVFYLTYVLSGLNREAQVVETLTFFLALLNALILWKNAYTIRKLEEYKCSFFMLIIIGLASFFFAGEEISWGQSYFYWDTPEIYRTQSIETNLHNNSIFPVHALGNIFLFSIFFILPFLYNKKKNISIFSSMSLSISHFTATFCILYAYLWKIIKDCYMYLYSKETLLTLKFYMEFVEQINEQKEMLIAVGIFVYAISINKRILLLKVS